MALRPESCPLVGHEVICGWGREVVLAVETGPQMLRQIDDADRADDLVRDLRARYGADWAKDYWRVLVRSPDGTVWKEHGDVEPTGSFGI